MALDAVKGVDAKHKPTGIAEFDRVLGGGFVDGSLTLLAGNPGIGKSTLVLQVAAAVGKRGDVLYVSGEESKEQLKLRYDRLKLEAPSVRVLSETDAGTAAATIADVKPSLAIIDSIQTLRMDSAADVGGVTAIRGATAMLLETAKRSGVPVLLIGHVTKEGVVAGPKTLEHLVDTVLYLEGDESQTLRLLRCVKHRFGVTDEVGVFAMTETGLEAVANPSNIFLLDADRAIPGTAVTSILEGTRPFLLDVQALVAPTVFGYPRRLASGMEASRLELLLAVLTRRAGLQLGTHDVHVNIVGGLKVREPAADLAVAVAIASALANKPLPRKALFLGEVGLAGEVRPVSRMAERLAEAGKIGFTDAYIPRQSGKMKKTALSLHEVTTLNDALQVLR